MNCASSGPEMDQHYDFASEDSDSDQDQEERLLRAKSHRVEVRPHPREHARTQYEGWEPPVPRLSEYKAIACLKAPLKPGDADVGVHSLVIELSDFELYRTPTALTPSADRTSRNKQYELTSLHKSRPYPNNLSFNGIISLGDRQYFIQDIPIKSYSIEGYGDEDDPTAVIYIQSHYGSRDSQYDIWYRLTKPASEYQSFHGNFQWIATFGKHVVDFLESAPERRIRLANFRSEFIRSRYKRFGANVTFKKWHEAYGSTDFRHAINAYSDYLYNQAASLSGSKLLNHPLWKECMKGGFGVKEQPRISKKTVVTPIVYACFKNMYFHSVLRRLSLAEPVRKQQKRQQRQLGFITDSPIVEAAPTLPAPISEATFKVGDVVGVSPDSDGHWKTKDLEWIVYVQRIEQVTDRVQRLFVLWLYRPTDTIIKNMIYPNKKELFLSNNCNCTESKLLSTDVTRRYAVEWLPKSFRTEKDFVITRKYVTQNDAFVDIKDSDFRCDCQKPKPTPIGWQKGDTVYIKTYARSGKILEPVIVHNWNSNTSEVTVRRLLRTSNLSYIPKDRPKPRPNELTWTDEFFTISSSRIQRECHIRFFKYGLVANDEVPSPYSRRGAGDYFYISTYLCARKLSTGISQRTVEPLYNRPGPFKEGHDTLSPGPSRTPLRGLSIFSGGGNLDRGIEESGAVRFTYAVDISASAVHTQRANAHDSSFKVYLGSVDDYQVSLSLGHNVKSIARIREIQFLAAGSPCPGFSMLQRDWLSERSKINASHITSFCSFVDIYRPQYAILENVVSLTNTRKGHEKENVFAQLIGCLVALGYQVQQFIMDAWNYGSAQQRSRIFVSIAAPGLQPLAPPFHTHSHPESVGARGLGVGANGQVFGSREAYATPFQYTTAGEATADLPNIGSGIEQVCIPVPDHRIPAWVNAKFRELQKRIPLTHSKSGYKTALDLNLIPPALLKTNKKTFGKMFSRIPADGQFPTMTTAVNPYCSFTGNLLHWERPTVITVQEARRAQGFPDQEVIIGSVGEQMTIVGNAVDRHVSFAIGLAVRKAWDTNYSKGLQPATLQLPKLDPVYQEEQDPISIVDEVFEKKTGENSLLTAKARSKRRTPPRAKTIPQRASPIVVADIDSEDEPVHTFRRSMISKSARRKKRYIFSSEEPSSKQPQSARQSLSKTRQVTVQGEDDEISFVGQLYVTATPPSIRQTPRTLPSRSARSIRHQSQTEVPDSEASSSTDILIRSPVSKSTTSRATEPWTENPLYLELDPLNIRGKRPIESPGEDQEARKKTRHSGLVAEFAPRRWDKVVEKDIGRSSGGI